MLLVVYFEFSRPRERNVSGHHVVLNTKFRHSHFAFRDMEFVFFIYTWTIWQQQQIYFLLKAKHRFFELISDRSWPKGENVSSWRMLSVEVHKREFIHLGSLHRRFIPCSLKHIRWIACKVKKDKVNKTLSSVCVTAKTFWKRTCCENFRWIWRTTYEGKMISLPTQQQHCFQLYINAKKLLCCVNKPQSQWKLT